MSESKECSNQIYEILSYAMDYADLRILCFYIALTHEFNTILALA